jgi:hypothetical protein
MPLRLQLVIGTSNQRVSGDDRQLAFRLFGYAWSDDDSLRPVTEMHEWSDPMSDLELATELTAMASALQRCQPVAGARAVIVDVRTLTADGDPSVRFIPHGSLVIQVTINAIEVIRALVVGVQVRDTHDRMLSGTRLDWHTSNLPRLASGQTGIVRFSTADLVLGRGLYQLTVGCHEFPNSGQIFHWVDGAWRFEVVQDDGSSGFVGQVDLGLSCTFSLDTEPELSNLIVSDVQD